MISDQLNRELMELIGYMVTSARGLVDEPKSYGPFRLIEGASRLCELLSKEDATALSDFDSHRARDHVA